MTSKVASECTIIFSGDITSTNEIFTLIKEKLIAYTKKTDGDKRQNYEIYECTDREIKVSGCASIKLSRHALGTVVLTHYVSDDLSRFAYSNFGWLLCNLHNYCESLAAKNGYTNATRCTAELPYSIVYMKDYIGAK